MGKRDIRVTFNDRQASRLEKKLRKFGEVVFIKVVARSSRAAMKPVLDIAKALAPRDTGLLSESMGIGSVKYAGSFTMFVVVGPRKGFKDPATGRNPFNYAHLLELGVKPHTLGGGSVRAARTGRQAVKQEGGKHPGIPASHFMKRVLANRKSRAVKIYIKRLTSGLRTETRKAARATKG